ncbi:MAG: hypothetical protein LH614_17115 [Pyrinomonadaceae bacterium]|nr:hypothetical protein [Pyrinomonadaceae bacterium]
MLRNFSLPAYKQLPDGALKFAVVREAITRLETYLAEQTSGAGGQAVGQKSVLPRRP